MVEEQFPPSSNNLNPDLIPKLTQSDSAHFLRTTDPYPNPSWNSSHKPITQHTSLTPKYCFNCNPPFPFQKPNIHHKHTHKIQPKPRRAEIHDLHVKTQGCYVHTLQGVTCCLNLQIYHAMKEAEQ
jgi:hypothetical protein